MYPKPNTTHVWKGINAFYRTPKGTRKNMRWEEKNRFERFCVLSQQLGYYIVYNMQASRRRYQYAGYWNRFRMQSRFLLSLSNSRSCVLCVYYCKCSNDGISCRWMTVKSLNLCWETSHKSWTLIRIKSCTLLSTGNCYVELGEEPDTSLTQNHTW